MPPPTAALLAVFACGAASAQPPRPEVAALVGGTIYRDADQPPIRGGTILVRDGRIAAVGEREAIEVPADAAVLDCAGLTVVAGFWNCHVHFFERKWADAGAIPAAELAGQLRETFVRFGFTSVFDTGSMWHNTRRLRQRIESGEVVGPRIHSTGEALIARGAMPPASVLRMMGAVPFPAPEIASEADASAAAAKLLADGVDAIKIHLQPPPPPLPRFPEAAIRAAVREAHRCGKPVFVHPDTAADVAAAVRSGVDVIAHTTPDSGPWSEDLLAAMMERRVALTPTLTLWRTVLRHDRRSARQKLVRTAVGQLHAWVEHGGTVLFGTDLGAVDPDPSEEYALMAQAGMTFQQILASLTTAPAGRFGEADRRGRVAPGLLADLVVLRDDPARSGATALAHVRYVLRAGVFAFGGHW